MNGQDDRNTDATVSISETDIITTTADVTENENNQGKNVKSSSPSKNHKFIRTSTCSSNNEWAPSECFCHAYRVTPCLPRTSPQLSNYERRRNFSWKWPRRSQRGQRPEKPYWKSDSTTEAHKTHNPFAPFNDNNNKILNSKEIQKNIGKATEKIEIYYFDHGNAAYFCTTDGPPLITTEKYADKSDQAATRFWAEIFGTIHIGITFITAFILQLLRFILYSLIRPLTIGIIQLISDYFIKPLLTIIFNSLIQPFLILLYNIATSLRDLCEPVAEAIGFFIRQLARLFHAIRLVEINKNIINENVPT